MTNLNHTISRRAFLKAGATIAAFAPGIQLIMPSDARAAGKVVIQYDWLMSNGQIGDVAAATNGYFKEAGLEVEFSPGGPNSATVPPVISGSAQLGQFSETPQLFNARASGIPVKILACGFRTGPYALTSKPITRLAGLSIRSRTTPSYCSTRSLTRAPLPFARPLHVR